MFGNDWKYTANAKTFENIDLSLFRNTKFWTVLNCIIFVWGILFLKLSLFASDIYTCIKLLAFNSWSNNTIQPYLPFRISKWLFSSCILASVILLLWEFIRGIRIYRTRNISLTYVNNFSRTAYSMGDYSKYCVYFKITPKGKFQKVAFFTFFELKDCLRLLFADTPRQVINGLTLWSVLITMNSENSNTGHGHLESFNGLITKIRTIAKTNHEEAVILSFMLFSFVIWAIFITKLIIAMIMSVYVYYKLIQSQEDSGLKEFVCVTINHNVDSLVEKQKKKKGLMSQPYRLSTLSKSSIFDEDIENKAGMLTTSTETPLSSIHNDSTTALVDPGNFNSYNNSGLTKIPTDGSWDSKYHQEMDLSQEPLNTTSMIYEDNHDKNRVVLFDVAKHLRGPRYNVVAMHSSDSLPSSESLVSQQALLGQKNLSSSTSSHRAKPPPPLLGAQNRYMSLARDENPEYERIYTPLRAYTRDGETRNNRFPDRYDSLLDRRQRIANEDYGHYLNKHRY